MTIYDAEQNKKTAINQLIGRLHNGGATSQGLTQESYTRRLAFKILDDTVMPRGNKRNLLMWEKEVIDRLPIN